MVVRKAVITAAGLNTRFLPAAKTVPKEMFPLIDKPIIQYLVEEAVEAGIEEIFIVKSSEEETIAKYFKESAGLNQALIKKQKTELLNELKKIESLAKIKFVLQKEALGLGHAVLCAKKAVGNEPFAVFYGDDLVLGENCSKKCIELFEKHKKSVIAVQGVPRKEVCRYGVLEIDKQFSENVFSFKGVIEKPEIEKAPSNLVVVGRHVLEPEIFDVLEKIPFGRGNELQLADAIQELNRSKPMLAYKLSGKWLTTGDPKNYLIALIEFALCRDELKEELSNFLREKFGELR